LSRSYMVRFVWLRGLSPTNLHDSISADFRASSLRNLRGSIFSKILIVAAYLLASVCVPIPAQAQHPVAHPGPVGHPGGGAHMGAPVSAPILRPPVLGNHGVGPRLVGPRFAGPRLAGLGPRGFGFRPGTGNVFRRRVFFGAPILWSGAGFRFGPPLVELNYPWWPTCTPSLGFARPWGFDCYSPPLYGFGFENYVTLPNYENSVYLYGEAERDLVWLYLKDGTGYGVTDYWLVNGQMHFSVAEDDPTKRAEHAIPYDELDIQKTTYVNTRRGFRIVFRDEPWQQYLKDHPDLTPPDQPPPQTK
jgi:hypothetical protein